MTMTSAALKERVQNGAVSVDDPAPKPKRRRFSAEYKLSVLEEYERMTEDGGKGAMLRREGLYSSHIVEWQRAREVGALSGLTPKHRVALEAQGKASELLAKLLAESTPETIQQPEQEPKR
jgi:transposase